MKRTLKKIATNEYILASGIFILLLCILFKPVIFENRTLFPILPGVTPDGPYGYSGEGAFTVIDPCSFIWVEVPLTITASEMIKSGVLPLWNPYIGCGVPLAANLMSGIYNPLRFFLLLFPQTWVFDFHLLLRIFLAGFFTFLFLRKISLSVTASLISAIAYMFSGHFMCYMTLWHLNADMMLPLLLLLFECNVQEKRRKYIVFAGVASALTILSGNPQAAISGLIFASCYYLYRAATINGFGLNSKLLRQSSKLIIILSIGLGLSAFMITDFYQFYRLSIHQVSISASDWGGQLNVYSPLSFLAFFFSPLQFLGTPFWNNPPYIDRFSHLFLFPYIGVISIILAVLALGKQQNIKRLGLFFIGYSFLMILNLIGAVNLLYQIGLEFLFPVTRLFWAKYLGVLYLSVAILAGLGLENIKNKKLLPRWNILFVSAIFLFIAGCFAACYYFYPAIYMDAFEIDVMPEGFLSKLLLPVSYPLTIRALLIAAFFSTLVFLVYRWRRRYLFALIGVLLFMELYIYYQPAYSNRHDPYKKAPYIEYLLKQQEEGELFRISGLGGWMIPQISSVFKLQDVRNIDAMGLEEYYHFMVRLILDTHWHYGVSSLTPTDIETVSSRYMDMLNVKYIISSNTLNPIKRGLFNLRGEELSKRDFSLGNTIKSFVILYPDNTHKSEYVNTAYFYYTIPPEGALLYFTLGTDPSQWSGKKNGVEFSVQVENDAGQVTHFRKYLDPCQNPEDRNWFSEEIDLSSYRGRKIKIFFKAASEKDDKNRFISGGFADIEIAYLNNTSQRFTPVYNQEVKIYRNNAVMPRAYIVHKAEKIFQREDILTRLKDENFDFRKSIIIEKGIPEGMASLNNLDIAEQSSVKIADYRPNRIELEAYMKNDGFMVLSDVYHPDWRAYVNGKPAEVYRTNYMLRSVFLPKGSHQIKFVYVPLPFITGAIISILTFIAVVLFLFYEKRKLY